MSRTTSVISGLLLLLLSTAPSLADQAHLLMGTWTVDLSKLTIPNPPRSVTIVLSVVGNGQYKMSVDIVDNDGGKRHGAGTFKADGTPSPVVGNADYDVVSMTMPSRRILVMGGGFQGHPSNTRVFSLSDDGKHMIETVVGHGPDGTPTTRVDVWNRQ
jgi:hypothetical protein